MSASDNQALGVLRSLRKKLRRAEHGEREALWLRWYAQLDYLHSIGRISKKSAAWLAIREHVFAPSWGLPLHKGGMSFFGGRDHFVLVGRWNGKAHTKQKAYEHQRPF